MVKLIKKYAYKLTVQVLLLIALFTTTYAHSSKTIKENLRNHDTLDKVEKPKLDMNTAAVIGDMDALTPYSNAGTKLNQKDAICSSKALLTTTTLYKRAIA